MQSTIKLAFPSIVFILAGMSVFFLLGVISLPPIGRKACGVLVSIILFFLSKAFLRYENIEPSAVHLIPNPTTFARLGLGIIIGAVLIGAMLFTLFTFTDIGIERIEEQAFVPFIIGAIAIIPLALMEEILFRGYPFFRLSQIVNIRLVIVVMASFFAVYHLNDSTTLISVFIGPGIWGVTFAVAAYLSKSIAVPLGMHISANLLQAIFGMKSQFTSMWELTKVANSSTTGIEPEVLGISMQIALLVSTVIVFEVAMRLKNNQN